MIHMFLNLWGGELEDAQLRCQPRKKTDEGKMAWPPEPKRNPMAVANSPNLDSCDDQTALRHPDKLQTLVLRLHQTLRVLDGRNIK
jgi:hypothetical protein